MDRTRSAIGRAVPVRSGIFLMKNETAAEALRGAGFGRGGEVFGFNQGTFSLIDLIDAVIEYTGAADCIIATWTAAKSDMEHVERWVSAGKIRSARWVVDRSFLNRQPKLCAHLRRSFGDHAIRVGRIHAKFVLLSSDDWSVTLLTSMNLNKNARIENYLVTDCPVLHREYLALVERIFHGQDDGDGFGNYSAVTRVMDAVSDGGRRKQRKKMVLGSPWRAPEPA